MMIKDKSLAPDVLDIIRQKATERPHTGVYDRLYQQGSYLCRGCGAALFRSHSKFNSSCGWPSFDAALATAVSEVADNDGIRMEIICTRCAAHLGHVFTGEGLTLKNRRYCVNSNSLDFVESTDIVDTEEAILAGGCFWGVEHKLRKLPGVLLTEVGYTGGNTLHPSYYAVCAGNTGHVEAVRVVYSPLALDYESLLNHFFQIHNPSQADGQGPDRGTQYLSAIFYYDNTQQQIAKKVMTRLQEHSVIATKLLPVSTFWVAEVEHQHYYD